MQPMTQPANEEEDSKNESGELPADSPPVSTEELAALAEAALGEAAPEEAPDERAELRQQVEVLKDQLLRAVAETENVRRRSGRDLEESGKYAISGFARELVQVFENLYRAAGTIDEQARAADEALNRYAEGIDMTLRELTSVFERFGIHRSVPMGEPFDPNLHQAVVQIEDTEHPADTVLQVMQAGYTIHDRLLQPAMVGVSRPPTPEAPTDTPAVDTQA